MVLGSGTVTTRLYRAKNPRCTEGTNLTWSTPTESRLVWCIPVRRWKANGALATPDSSLNEQGARLSGILPTEAQPPAAARRYSAFARS